MYSNIRELMVPLLAIRTIAGVWAQATAPSMPEAIINLNKFNGACEAKLTSMMRDKSYQCNYNVK